MLQTLSTIDKRRCIVLITTVIRYEEYLNKILFSKNDKLKEFNGLWYGQELLLLRELSWWLLGWMSFADEIVYSYFFTTWDKTLFEKKDPHKRKTFSDWMQWGVCEWTSEKKEYLVHVSQQLQDIMVLIGNYKKLVNHIYCSSHWFNLSYTFLT